MTTISRSKYLSNTNVCPNCGSDDLDGGSFNADCDVAWQRITCGNCNIDWEDTYRLVDIDTVQDIEGNDIEVVD